MNEDTFSKKLIWTCAKVLLERGVPVYISGAVLDESICIENPSMNGSDDRFQRYRRGLITRTSNTLGYTVHAHSGGGHPTFRMIGDDRDALKVKLEKIVAEGRDDS
jgi:hypothetical protein